MAAYYLIFAQSVTDWTGYQLIWEGWADWLGGRDPLFRAILDASQSVLGPDGYEDFRTLVLLAELGVVGWLVSRSSCGSPLFSALGFIAACVLGLTAQLREGIAFLVAIALASPPLGNGRGVILAIAGALIASLVHASAVVFVGLLVMAVIFNMLGLRPGRLFGLATSMAGVAIAVVAFAHADQIRLALAENGVGIEAETTGGVAKVLYWLAMGGAVVVLCGELRERAHTGSGIAARWFDALACVALPFVFTFTGFLALGGFPTPALTTLGERLLRLLMDAAVIACLLRRRPGWRLAGVSGFMLVDATRLLITAST